MFDRETLLTLLDHLREEEREPHVFIMSPAQHKFLTQLSRRAARMQKLVPRPARKLRKCHLRKIQQRLQRERKRYQ